MIKVKKKVVTTFSVELDSPAVEQLDLWLYWALAVWQQCQQFPQLEDEIFHGTDKMGLIRKLNHDKNILLRLALKSPEVEEE